MTAQIIQFAPRLARARRRRLHTDPTRHQAQRAIAAVHADVDRRLALMDLLSRLERAEWNLHRVEGLVKRSRTLVERGTFKSGPRKGMPHDSAARANALQSLEVYSAHAADWRDELQALRDDLARLRAEE